LVEETFGRRNVGKYQIEFQKKTIKTIKNERRISKDREG
jgi:hypothetical protein